MSKTYILFLYSGFALVMFKLNTPSFKKNKESFVHILCIRPHRTPPIPVQMEQKSFCSGIKVQSPSKSMTTIPAIPAFPVFHSLRWNGWNSWNTLPVLPIPKKCCIPFTIPLFHLFLFPKIIKRNTVLIIFRNTN